MRIHGPQLNIRHPGWMYKTIDTTTGGAAIPFDGIPPGVTDVDVFCMGVSLSGTEPVTIRIGPSGGLESASYVGGASTIANTVTDTAFSSSFLMNESPAAANTHVLEASLKLVNPATNLWLMTGKGSISGGGSRFVSVGQKALAGALNLLTVKSNSGDTFDVNGGVQIRFR